MSEYDIEIEALKEQLLLSEKRYEIAIGFSDVTSFDYNVVTKKIITQQTDFNVFGMPAVMENGVEDVIKSGIIATRSIENLRDLYRRIDAGEPTAKTIIYANAVDGGEHLLEIYLVNIFNKKGEPIYAVGARKDITETSLLKKEEAYKMAIESNMILIFEANISTDRYTNYNNGFF
ncbi:hypothetical protein [Anaerorhabdus sp.]|uniref:hypothetical protein n=1 Tax=Anaerorhabdus sp. TaxID=1872524 RepID=UPI002FCA6E9E